MQMREKVGKSRNTVFFQWFVAPEGRKVGSLKRRVRSHLARWEMKKVHAVVARSTFRSQNVQSTPGPDYVWKLRCEKKCTPQWRKAHFEVTMYKTHHSRNTFGSWDVEKVHAAVARSTFRSQNVQNAQLRTTFTSCDVEKVHAVVARSTFRSQHVQKTPCSDHVWRFRCRFAWQAQGIVHLVKSEQNVRVLWHFQLQPTLHHTTLQYITLHYNYNYTFTTFHYTTLHYTTLHYTPLHYTTLNYIQLHYATLHYTPLHYTTLHYTTLPSTTLHYITLHSTTTTTT